MQCSVYESKELKQDEVLQLIDHLRDMHVRECSVQFLFKTKPELEEAEAQYDLMTGFVHQTKPQYKPRDKTSTEVASLHFSKTSVLELKLFFRAYKERLAQLEKEFRVRITNLRHDIIIEGEHSAFLKQEIFMLKDKLKIHYNRDHFQKVKYSTVLRGILTPKHIFVQTSYDFALFYSIKLSLPEMKLALLQILKYYIDIVVVRIHSYLISKRLFSLLTALQPDLSKEIQQRYELQLEINRDEMAYVLHSKHPVFGKEPINHLYHSLSPMRIIELRSAYPIAVNNQVKKMRRKHPLCLSEAFEQKSTTIAINSELVNQEIVLSIIEVFLQVLQPSSMVVIYLPHYQLEAREKEHQRIIKETRWVDFVFEAPKIIKVRPRAPFELQQNQREMLVFLFWLLFATTTIELTEEQIQMAFKKRPFFQNRKKKHYQSYSLQDSLQTQFIAGKEEKQSVQNQENMCEEVKKQNMLEQLVQSNQTKNNKLYKEEDFVQKQTQENKQLQKIEAQQVKNDSSWDDSLKKQVQQAPQQKQDEADKSNILKKKKIAFEKPSTQAQKTNLVKKVPKKYEKMLPKMEQMQIQLQSHASETKPMGPWQPFLQTIDYIEPKKMTSARIEKGTPIQKVQALLNKESGSFWKCNLVCLHEQIVTNSEVDAGSERRLVREPLRHGDLFNSARGLFIHEVGVGEQVCIVFWDKVLLKNVPVYICKRIK